MMYVMNCPNGTRLNKPKNHHMSIYQYGNPTSFKAYSFHYFVIAWGLDIDWQIQLKEKVNHLIIWHTANQSQKESILHFVHKS